MFPLEPYLVIGFYCVSIGALMQLEHFKRTTIANIDTNYRIITTISSSSRIGCALRCMSTTQCKYYFHEPASHSCHLLSYNVNSAAPKLQDYQTWEAFVMPTNCLVSGQYYDTYQKCVVFYTHMEKSWNDAQDFCQSDGGSLMTLNSYAEFEFFRLMFFQLLQQPQFFNLGAKKTGPLFDDFHWVFGPTVGVKVASQYWYMDQPDNLFGDEFCIASRWDDGFFLNDVTCEWYPGYFICEYL